MAGRPSPPPWPGEGSAWGEVLPGAQGVGAEGGEGGGLAGRGEPFGARTRAGAQAEGVEAAAQPGDQPGGPRGVRTGVRAGVVDRGDRGDPRGELAAAERPALG